MTDQTPADLADKVRKLAARFRQQMEPHTPAAEYAVWECAAEAVETLLSPPPRPTLADMTEEERAACQWMQADVKGYESRVVIVNPYWEEGSARVMWLHTRMVPVSWKSVTPRPDLPCLEWPGTEKPAPAPALPDGWLLADHPKHGRVIVTTTTPDDDGDFYFMFPADDLTGYDWDACRPDELTYLDGDQ